MDKTFIIGYGWTGASAVIDALRLHTNVNFVPNEFEDLRVPYGAYDLYQQKIAIINGITPHSFSAYAEFDSKSMMPRSRIKGFLNAIPSLIRSVRIPIPFTNSEHIDKYYRKYFFKNFFRVWSEGKLFKSFVYNLDKASTAKQAHDALLDWIENISLLYSERPNKTCVFDQGLLIENAGSILQLLPNTKLILVIRDPYKQISNMLTNNSLRGMSWRTRYFFGVDDCDLNRVFLQFARITAYRLKLFISLYKMLGNKHILIVDYDIFLSDFRNEFQRICKFLHVDIMSENIGGENFDLEKSRNKNNKMSLDLNKYQEIIDIIQPVYKKVKKFSYD